MVALGELAQPAGSKAGSQSNLPVYSVTKHAGFVPSLEYFKKQVFSRDLEGYKRVEPGDFAYATIHLDEGSIGIAPRQALISPMYTVFRVDDSKVSPHYLIRYLKSPRALSQYPRLGRGAIHRRKAISLSALGELAIPLPPLPEQRRIAAILDHADALRAKRRQVLAHLDALTQSIFHDMFGNELWAATLGELADVQIGPFGSLLHQSDYVSGGVVVINPMHIRGGTLQPDPEFSVTERKASTLELYRLQSGDVVLGRRGEMARAGVAGAEHAGMLCGTGSIILRPRGVDSRFLHAVVTSPRMKEHLDRRALGATLPNLNAAIVKGSPSPRAIGEAQAMFSAAIGRVDQARADATAACAADDELFASLQYRAFRGEL